MKKKILIFTGYYLPSIKGGGPIQSIKNLVENLDDKFEFSIITSDRDLGDSGPFETIVVDKWIEVGKAKVFYTNTSELSWQKTKKIMKNIDYDAIYLNSFFSYKMSIVPFMINKYSSNKKHIVIAPRGQFSRGAIALKNSKKTNFLKLVKKAKIYKNVIWHATAETEKYDIQTIFKPDEKIKVANNLTEDYRNLEYKKNIDKSIGKIKFIFLSRIHPKKNLKKAIEWVRNLEGEIEFNIYGPIEDEKYWEQCNSLIKDSSPNVEINYKGLINHVDIREVFASHHFLLFPTLGENYGHVISEALVGGCPVIISDQTPWSKLERIGVGWEVNLKNEEIFKEILIECIKMDQEEYNILSKNAFEYGKKNSNSEKDILDNYNLFY